MIIKYEINELNNWTEPGNQRSAQHPNAESLGMELAGILLIAINYLKMRSNEVKAPEQPQSAMVASDKR